MTSSLALLRFHLASGIRVALRLLMPLVVVYTVLVGFFGPGLLRNLATVLFPTPWTGTGVALLVISTYAVARQGARLLTPGPTSWLRHLPLSTRSHRLAATGALILGQTPLAVGLVALAWLSTQGGARELGPVLAGVLGLTLASSSAAERSEAVRIEGGRARLGELTTLAAATSFATTTAPGLLGGSVLLAVASIDALGTRRRRRVRRVRPARRPRRIARTTWGLHLLLLWRACGPAVASGGALAILALGGSLLFVHNNELPERYALLGLRLGAGLAVSFTLLGAVGALIERRPRWAWMRSLPESSRDRVLRDAAVLCGLALVPVVAAAATSQRPIAVLMTTLPLLLALSTRAAGTVAAAGSDATRGPGALAGESMLASLLVCLLPWTALPFLLAVPWLLRRATERERRAPVTTFAELRAAGSIDPLRGGRG